MLRQWRVAMARYRYHHAIGLIAGLGGLATILWAIFSLWELLVRRRRPAARVPGTAPSTRSPRSVSPPRPRSPRRSWCSGSRPGGTPRCAPPVGILWDMVSFWPRVAHPLCPLPYGGRAVRAVAKRASELATEDLSEDGQGRRAPVRQHRALRAQPRFRHRRGGVRRAEGGSRSRVVRSLDPGRAGRGDHPQDLAGHLRLADPVHLCAAVPELLRLRPPAGDVRRHARDPVAQPLPLDGPVGRPRPQLAARGTHATAHDRYGPAVLLWNTMACADDCEGHRPERVDGPEIDGVCTDAGSSAPISGCATPDW